MSTLDENIHIRVSGEALERFKTKCEEMTGRPYQSMIREFIDATNEGRLKIKRPVNQKKAPSEGLYE